MAQQTSATPIKLNFHFDPLCPLAWRTALWMREVRQVRPVAVTWRFFSLELVNRKEGAQPNYEDHGWAGLRTLALVRRREGNEGVERYYLALGAALHGRRESISDAAGVRAALERAGLNAGLVDEALADESTIREVEADHQEAVERYHAFGVPTIALEGSQVGFYGPVIIQVPRGAEAGEYWDHFYWALQQPNLYELKRERVGVKLEPIAE
ncbi:DsbA family protein [Thermogemmatispora carboxidivorans]|uniref:mycothiol-dependent nitroreductase Rv2466c family protein n=1 Tax=Thermogemmatispora carboxidivorans TaxID=1382306 RepID=UPI00069B291A|nr:DsbA family protein [Thermogemmatispora carboxidivorans]